MIPCMGLIIMALGWLGQDFQSQKIDESVLVLRKSVEVRVVNAKGKPVKGLQKEDFQLTLGDRTIPLTQCEWYERAVPESELLPTEKGRSLLGHQSNKEPNRKLVFFFQGDFSGHRTGGILKGALFSKDMIKSVRKTDWVAIFSFTSHLNLNCDWTSDKFQIEEAITDAFRNTEQFWPSDDPFHCLEDLFDSEKAREIASPEEALGYIGQLLRHEKGVKNLIYVGWGLGRYSRIGVTMTPDFQPAISQLTLADVAVFTLDISQADYHSLEVGLKNVSNETGGFYERTFRFTGRAFDRVLNALEGYYLVTFEPPAEEIEKNFNYSLKLNHVDGRVLVKNPRFW